MGARMCPCGAAIESRTHILGACGTNKEKRDVLKGRGDEEICGCDMEVFGRLES